MADNKNWGPTPVSDAPLPATKAGDRRTCRARTARRSSCRTERVKRSRAAGLYRGMRNKVILIALGSLLATSRSSDAKQCLRDDGMPRWTNSISQCDVASTFCSFGSPVPLTQGQLRILFATRFADTPALACKQLVAKANLGSVTQAQRDLWRLVYSSTPGIFQCTYDVNGDGKVGGIVQIGGRWFVGPTPEIYGDFSSYHPTIVAVDTPTESMCDRIPNGPNKDDVSFGNDLVGPGREFSPTQRDLVKEQTAQGFEGIYRSQAFYLGIDAIEQLDDLAPPSQWWGRPEVDHIIPRVDIQGCACGPNSPANALVISASLNRQMSNFSQHPKRLALLDIYTLAPIAPASTDANIQPSEVGDDLDPDLAAEEADTMAGGCSAGGGSLSMSVILLGLALRTRRTRR